LAPAYRELHNGVAGDNKQNRKFPNSLRAPGKLVPFPAVVPVVLEYGRWQYKASFLQHYFFHDQLSSRISKIIIHFKILYYIKEQ